jgi:hypothetical protein
MSFQPALRAREPAVPMEPVIDPAGWYPADLAANDGWIYDLTETEADEIRQIVAQVEDRGLDILEIRGEDLEMPTLDRSLAMLYDELLNGRGFFLLRGVPVADFNHVQAAAAFWAIGSRFGRPVSQNNKGHLLGHVKDFGGDYNAPDVRGYQTNAELNFHCDQCDYVALLCMHPSKSGGASRIASGVTVYNEMLKAYPDLVRELIAEFYVSRHGEVSPGQDPWYKLPVYSFHDGYFSGRGASGHAIKAQDIPGVPAMTENQLLAFKTFRDVAKQFYFDMDFRPGDIQILHNHVTLHSRTTFEDWPEIERKRHLMRLWLTDPAGRPLIPGFREAISGVNIKGVAPKAPVNSFEPA